MKKSGKEYTIIVGCGRLGASLANALSDGEENVCIVDKNPEAFRKLMPSFAGMTVIGDATDFEVWKDINVSGAAAVITVTNHDNTNILVAQMVREVFHVEHVIARLYDPERECVFQALGIETICPAVLSSQAIHGLLEATH